MKIFVTLILVIGVSVAARAQLAEIQIAFDQGLVTLTAKDAPVTDVLAEWARVGNTAVFGADQLPLRKITLMLNKRDELAALRAVIGSGAGFVAWDRPEPGAGLSRFATLVIAAPRRAPGARARSDEIEVSIPEARFAYPTPSAASPVDPNSSAGIATPRRTASPPESAEPPLMPELRFQYPGPLVPAPTDVPPAPASAANLPAAALSDAADVDIPEARFAYPTPFGAR